MLVANNISLVIYSIVMSERLLTHEVLTDRLPKGLHSEGSLLLIQTFLSTIVILISAEFIPKVLFRLNPNGILNILALPIQAVYYLLYPIVWVLLGISRFIMRRVFRIDYVEERPIFGRIDLDLYIRDITSKNSQAEEMDTEIRIFQNALDFKDVKVRETMVPRNEIVAVDVTESIEELRKLFVETKLSRILVYRESIDNIIGFVHHSELFRRPATIQEVLLPVSIVPEVMNANNLLKQFTAQHRSVAVVVDEFGGTAGMATFEDVMEEIFGEIQDEHDVPEEIENNSANTSTSFPADWKSTTSTKVRPGNPGTRSLRDTGRVHFPPPREHPGAERRDRGTALRHHRVESAQQPHRPGAVTGQPRTLIPAMQPLAIFKSSRPFVYSPLVFGKRSAELYLSDCFSITYH